MEIRVVREKPTELSEEGILYCVVSLAYPVATGNGREVARVGRFYRTLTEGILALARGILLPNAKARYAQSTDPRRRFTQRPYRLDLETHLSASESETEVRRTLSLSHRGRTLLREEVCEVILPGGRILPQKGAKKPR